MGDEALAPELEAALADKSMLGTYQDEPVLKTTIKLTKAGDGLSKSLAIAPQLLPIGSKGMLLVAYEVVAHNHKHIKDVEAFEVTQTLEAQIVTVVDDRSSERKIERQRRALEKAEQARKGVERLRDQSGEELEVDGDLDGPDGDEDEWEQDGE